MITYLIVDDESIAHDIISGYCDMLPNMQLMKNCYDAIEALEYLNEHKVDLIFLDLNMPKLKGFEFLRTLPSPPKIIVTTAYKEYALEGYELNIVDYLLKPFGFERFLTAVNKAFNSTSVQKSAVSHEGNNIRKTIFLKSDKKYVQVEIDSILYAEAAGNYVKITTLDAVVLIREKISDLIKMLDSDDLMQVHKSFIVSKKHIKSIEGNRIVVGEYNVPIGKTYKSIVNQLLR